jgi:hypothetical protein
VFDGAEVVAEGKAGLTVVVLAIVLVTGATVLVGTVIEVEALGIVVVLV